MKQGKLVLEVLAYGDEKSKFMTLERCILGTAGLGGVWGPVDPQESVRSILYALENGIGAIDTAPAYGNAEAYIGEALGLWHGNTPQISTKVGRLKSHKADDGIYDYSSDAMLRSVEQSLKTLGVPVLDVLFLHEPAVVEQKAAEQVMETLLSFKEKGFTRKIGLGGNPPSWMIPYLESGVFDVLMEFNTLNACNTIALEENLSFCLYHNIEYYAASPLNMGLLGSRYSSFVENPPSWLNRKLIDTAIRVKALADERNLSLPSLAHRFLLSLPNPFRVVIGASNLIELAATIEDFRIGPLPDFLVTEIMQTQTLKLLR